MSKTNCVNCGAAKDIDELKCPFCGTTYLDFTAIDFASGDPVVCQFVIPWTSLAGKRTVMSMMARPVLNEISMTSSPMEVTNPWDNRRIYLQTQPEMNVEISFCPIEMPDGTMFKLRAEEE